jgi:hypothetical protein
LFSRGPKFKINSRKSKGGFLMDINQQDRAALNANLCPDCGGPVSFEETGPWCRACDVWFEFNISGWVIRNSDATQFYNLLKAAKKDRKAAPVDREAAYRQSRPSPPELRAVRQEREAAPVDEKMLRQKQLKNPKEIVSPVTFYPRQLFIPLSLYRWFI